MEDEKRRIVVRKKMEEDGVLATSEPDKWALEKAFGEVIVWFFGFGVVVVIGLSIAYAIQPSFLYRCEDNSVITMLECKRTFGNTAATCSWGGMPSTQDVIRKGLNTLVHDGGKCSKIDTTDFSSMN